MLEGVRLTPLGAAAVLMEPGEGLDPSDPDAYIVPILDFLQRHHATCLIYDLSKAAIIDDVYYGWLAQLHHSCRWSGVEMVGASLQPAAAFALASLLSEPPPFRIVRDVESARRRSKQGL